MLNSPGIKVGDVIDLAIFFPTGTFDVELNFYGISYIETIDDARPVLYGLELDKIGDGFVDQINVPLASIANSTPVVTAGMLPTELEPSIVTVILPVDGYNGNSSRLLSGAAPRFTT